MCGIFGIVSAGSVSKSEIKRQARFAERRGKDSSGLLFHREGAYTALKADYETTTLLSETDFGSADLVIGHSRLITDGMNDNQPVVRNGVAVLHNGIILNGEVIWPTISVDRELEIDTEIILGLTLDSLSRGDSPDVLAQRILVTCRGTLSAVILIVELGKLILLSNNGSLYLGYRSGSRYFASEKYFLSKDRLEGIHKINGFEVIDVPKSGERIKILERTRVRPSLIPALSSNLELEGLLKYRRYTGRRCSKCILPESMPFISFDLAGVCNYCNKYTPRNNPRPISVLKSEISSLINRSGDVDCIVPFSGGRDSTYALHIISKELGLKPITFTYDWGMVTDLARRNISRVCSSLGVENIIVADDIQRKRRFIATNLIAWLKKPHLGMLNILMAGDKHFFRFLEDIKKETSIELNIWGMCPLETTHFKAGFLGVAPYFEERKVYTSGLGNQIRYQSKRFKRMIENPGYFNSSLWDTLSGEYYRSIKPKTGYFHIFDFHQWKEEDVNSVLDSYDWERAPDTDSTWRIGDGTAAFYNYIYRTVAGFTEHDTFRSNQIREGDIDRQKALALVEIENRPRYHNIKWYLDALGLEFKPVIATINSIPKLF